MYPTYQSRGDELKIVNGKASAEQYLMYPNSRTILLDANADKFYLKTTDAAGMATIKTYEFSEIDDSPQPVEYITEEKIKELIKNELNSIKSTDTNIAAQF